jgi:F-type H+-transporting ATPase subunit delta
MTKRTAQQARALFEVAERASQIERVADEMDWFAGVLRLPDAARTLLNPVVPPDKKVDIIRALAAEASLSPIVEQLLGILADRDRLGDLEGMASAFRQKLRERQNIVSADVTTAVALPTSAVQAIGRRLGELSGKQVEVGARVDPSIIGGVVARIGSTVYDGSVTGQLSRMRQKLVENV